MNKPHRVFLWGFFYGLPGQILFKLKKYHILADINELANKRRKKAYRSRQNFQILTIFVCMRTVNFKIPDTVDLDDKDIAMIVASTLYEKGKLSLGQAAELAGLTKRTFAELLGKYDVSIFNYPPSDLTRDVKNA